MFRLCFSALVAAILLLLTNTALMAKTEIEDMGCVNGGAYWNYENVHRIIIYVDGIISYLDEYPCGSGKWYERHRVSATPPATLTNPGVFTSTGTIEFHQAAATSGIITAGSGPERREFISNPTSMKLVISAPVAQSLMESLR